MSGDYREYAKEFPEDFQNLLEGYRIKIQDFIKENEELYPEVLKLPKVNFTPEVFYTREKLLELVDCYDVAWEAIFKPDFTMEDEVFLVTILAHLMEFEKQINISYKNTLKEHECPDSPK